MANLLCLLIGLCVGFWGWNVYSSLQDLKERLQAKREYAEAGVVKPQSRQIPRVDLTSPTGGVRRPSPDEILIANMKERDEKLKRLR